MSAIATATAEAATATAEAAIATAEAATAVAAAEAVGIAKAVAEPEATEEAAA